MRFWFASQELPKQIIFAQMWNNSQMEIYGKLKPDAKRLVPNVRNI